jgi:hypothetical protein
MSSRSSRCRANSAPVPGKSGRGTLCWANTRLVHSCGPKMTIPTMINSKAIRTLYSHHPDPLVGRGTRPLWNRPVVHSHEYNERREKTGGDGQPRIDPCALVQLPPRIRAILRGLNALHDSSLPSLPRAMLRHRSSEILSRLPIILGRNGGITSMARSPSRISLWPHRNHRQRLSAPTFVCVVHRRPWNVDGLSGVEPLMRPYNPFTLPVDLGD